MRIIKHPAFWLFSGIIILSLLTFWLKRKVQIITQEGEKELPPEPSDNLLNFEETSTFEELDSSTQQALVKKLTQLFSNKINIPNLTFNPDWSIKILPNTLPNSIQFEVWNEEYLAPVTTKFSPSEDAENWIVQAQDLETTKVPIQDSDQLRAVIASYLQQVSPLQPNNDEN